MLKKLINNKWIKWIAGFLCLFFLLILGFYASIYYGFFGKIPEQEELSNLSHIQASQVFDRNEKLIGKYFITDRESIPFEEIPEELIQALIATEDARFYEHNGVDQQSVMRVLLKTILMQDKSSGGGSTITLQLAKNLHGRKNFAFMSVVINKIRESIVARRLEKIYDKNEILTLYLNTVPFSGDTYGIESAAQKFFNTKTKNLTLSQAATLVGTLKANHSYNPRLFPERSQLRRDVVLKQMEKYGFLTTAETIAVMKEKIKIDYKNYGSSTAPAPYFVEQVRKETKKILADKKYRKPDGSAYKIKEDGLKIYTTLDAKMQKYAEESMRKHLMELQEKFENSFGNNPPWRANSEIVQKEIQKLSAYKKLSRKGFSKAEMLDSLSIAKETELYNWKKNEVKSVSVIDSLRHYLKFLNTGMVSLDPHSGAVLTYIGGIDYRYFQYDHVSQSKRQVGSTIKPFVYATALENGIKPCDYYPANEVTYTDLKNWRPRNANKNIDEKLNYSLSEALTQSLNTITIKVLRDVGIQKVIDKIQEVGIKEKIENQPSIALGVSEIKLLDLAKAYAVFLNEGKPVNPYFIEKIEDKNGNIIAEFHPKQESKEVFKEKTRQQTLEILKNVVNKGTAQRLRNVYHFQNDLAGKTGTTQENKDGWFVGLLPDLVTVTWVGNDNSQIKFPSTALGQGANSALPIFAGMLQKMNADEDFNTFTTKRFEKPSAEILASLDCPPTEKDGFFEKVFGKNTDYITFEKSEKEIKKETRKEKRKRKRKERREARKEKKRIFRKIFGGKKNK